MLPATYNFLAAALKLLAIARKNPRALLEA